MKTTLMVTLSILVGFFSCKVIEKYFQNKDIDYQNEIEAIKKENLVISLQNDSLKLVFDSLSKTFPVFDSQLKEIVKKENELKLNRDVQINFIDNSNVDYNIVFLSKYLSSKNCDSSGYFSSDTTFSIKRDK